MLGHVCLLRLSLDLETLFLVCGMASEYLRRVRIKDRWVKVTKMDETSITKYPHLWMVCFRLLLFLICLCYLCYLLLSLEVSLQHIFNVLLR